MIVLSTIRTQRLVFKVKFLVKNFWNIIGKNILVNLGHQIAKLAF